MFKSYKFSINSVNLRYFSLIIFSSKDLQLLKVFSCNWFKIKIVIDKLEPLLNTHTNHNTISPNTQNSITIIHTIIQNHWTKFQNCTALHLYLSTSLLDSLTFWVLAWSRPFETKRLSSTATVTKAQALRHLRGTVFVVFCTGRTSHRLLALGWTFPLCSRASWAGEHSFFQTDLLTAKDKVIMVSHSY